MTIPFIISFTIMGIGVGFAIMAQRLNCIYKSINNHENAKQFIQKHMGWDDTKGGKDIDEYKLYDALVRYAEQVIRGESGSRED